MLLTKLPLANVPTPLFRHRELDRLVGTRVWVKRDDMTGGVETGNKIRKLEYLLADAERRGATTLVTCGGLQSNHCRAAAVLGRRCGMASVLLLRTGESRPPTPTGNLFIDELVAADIRLITPEQYADRDRLMAEVAEELRRAGETPYVIPEGGSNGLGALGYVDAMDELRVQVETGTLGAPRCFDAIAVACGSGGTAAGVGLGAEEQGVAGATLAFAVCDDARYFRERIARLVEETCALRPSLPGTPRIRVIDDYKGPAYAVPSEEQLDFIIAVARATGLVLDPVYTGKAMYGLSQLRDRPDNVCFVHTGGFPGLLADAARTAAHPAW